MSAPTTRKSTPDELFSTLSQSETAWKDKQEFLQSRGYMLRPRYRPGWTPSWRETGEHPSVCEDSISLPHRPSLIDATRISDGELVYLKMVKADDLESQIATMLSSPRLRLDPRNHCVPILEIFQDEDDAEISYMVMPFLHLIDTPDFELVNSVVEFIDQILEGLVFLHRQGVAHRDCAYKNVMMDASRMYPHGVHPVFDLYLPDARTINRPLPRSSVTVKYYFVDFGISTSFPPDVHPTHKLVLGEDGRDQDVPELSADTPYNPFKVDVFIIGNLLRHEFHDKFTNVNFLVPLIDAMTQVDPLVRHTAEEALEQWKSIRPRLYFLHRRWRLRPWDELPIAKAIYDTAALIRVTAFIGSYVVAYTTDLLG